MAEQQGNEAAEEAAGGGGTEEATQAEPSEQAAGGDGTKSAPAVEGGTESEEGSAGTEGGLETLVAELPEGFQDTEFLVGGGEGEVATGVPETDQEITDPVTRRKFGKLGGDLEAANREVAQLRQQNADIRQFILGKEPTPELEDQARTQTEKDLGLKPDRETEPEGADRWQSMYTANLSALKVNQLTATETTVQDARDRVTDFFRQVPDDHFQEFYAHGNELLAGVPPEHISHNLLETIYRGFRFPQAIRNAHLAGQNAIIERLKKAGTGAQSILALAGGGTGPSTEGGEDSASVVAKMRSGEMTAKEGREALRKIKAAEGVGKP